jgi:hypothetical protein
MTLCEAVNHIQAVECTDQAGALNQLRMALGDGDIPTHWAADPLPPGVYSIGDPSPFSSDQVPTDAMYWLHVLIVLDGDGRVIDQPFYRDETQEPPLPRPRQLLLLRTRVFELWPLSNHERKERGSTTQPKKLRRRKVEEDEIRRVARDIYRENENDPPNKPTAERLIRQRLGGGKRPDIRKILEEVEFHGVRREPGNQPKK